MARNNRGNSSARTQSSSNSDRENKSCCTQVGDAFAGFFLGIAAFFQYIWACIVAAGMFILSIFEFIWYPFKEQGSKCCNWCGNKRKRSNDPSFSAFDNEV